MTTSPNEEFLPSGWLSTHTITPAQQEGIRQMEAERAYRCDLIRAKYRVTTKKRRK